MNVNTKFVGRLMAWKGDDESNEQDTMVEVTEVDNATGEVELAFDDRNERVYLRMKLHELWYHIGVQS
jgi:hypothetical protein